MDDIPKDIPEEQSDIVDEVIPEDTSTEPIEVKIKPQKKEITPYDSTEAQEYEDLRDEDRVNIKKDLKIDG